MGLGRDLVDKSNKAWNEHLFNEWSALFTEDAQLTAPGGLSGRGREAQKLFYSIWNEGFPENRVTNIRATGDDETAVLEAVFEGTHTGVLRAPSGDIPPTGKQVSIPFVVTWTIEDGHFSSFRLYFDQLDLVNQLGLG